ncbi:MAG: HAD-IIIA family hydrolase [Candidatus Saelkia tenebricola]|nr:HAD-IIIA family hydrolase [Candidatus Saelkia tenebricola]
MINQDIIEKAKNIKLLLLDADGVLTDGKIYYGSYGDEIKAFDVKDGLSLSLWNRAGKMSCIITAKKSSLLKRRARELRVFKVYQNAFRKIDVYEKIKKKFRLQDSQICFIGDDLIDIAVLKRVGLSITVLDAPSEVREVAHYMTDNKGGSGAVREVVEIILKAQGAWKNLIQGLGSD